MAGRRRVAWLSLAMLAGVGACSGQAPTGGALGEVHDPQLRGYMSQLERILISDLDDATRSETVRQDLVRIAEDLQAIARKLPDLAPQLDLDEADRSRFVVFADSLGASASRLGRAAATADAAVIHDRIDEVTDACSGCHWGYRVGPGR